MGIGVSEEPTLEHLVGRRTDPRHEVARVEAGLLDIAEIVVGVPVQGEPAHFDQRVVRMRRLGINHTQLPVNAPQATEVHNYGRDGLMAGHGNGCRAKNYEPNSFDGPLETGLPYAEPIAAGSPSGTFEWDNRSIDNFTQAGDLYRLQPADAQQRLVGNIAEGLAECRLVPPATASSSAASPTSGRPTPSSASESHKV